MVEKTARESLHLRVPEDLKRQVEAFATETGIPINAAAILLLRAGLRERDRAQ